MVTIGWFTLFFRYYNKKWPNLLIIMIKVKHLFIMIHNVGETFSWVSMHFVTSYKPAWIINYTTNIGTQIFHSYTIAYTYYNILFPLMLWEKNKVYNVAVLGYNYAYFLISSPVKITNSVSTNLQLSNKKIHFLVISQYFFNGTILHSWQKKSTRDLNPRNVITSKNTNFSFSLIRG